MSTKLAHQTQKTAGIGNGMRTATVAAVSGGTVTLNVNGGLISSGVGVLDSYTPQVGDVVAVFRQDSSWLVMGAIAPPASGLAPRNIDTGTVLMSFTAVTSATAAVTFDAPFPAAPMVATNIDSGAGATAQWSSRAISITTTGFTMFVFAAAAGTWSNVPVSWSATARS